MESIFGRWIGRPVVVQLGLGGIKLSVRGTFLEDRDQTFLVRPEVGSDVEIPKAKVLAIEETLRRSKPFRCVGGLDPRKFKAGAAPRSENTFHG